MKHTRDEVNEALECAKIGKAPNADASTVIAPLANQDGLARIIHMPIGPFGLC